MATKAFPAAPVRTAVNARDLELVSSGLSTVAQNRMKHLQKFAKLKSVRLSLDEVIFQRPGLLCNRFVAITVYTK